MRRRAGNWRLAVAILLIGGVGILIVAVILIKGLDDANKVAGLLGITALGSTVLSWARKARVSSPEPEQLARAHALFKAEVCRRVRSEVTRRELLSPKPLHVRWRPTARNVSDHPENIGATMSAASDDVPRLAADFLSLPRRRLVVIGAPGSGKTTLSLLLSFQLACEEGHDRPVPVLLSCASWNQEREELPAWIARRISTDYSSISGSPDLGSDMAIHLLESGRVLPVLDGLDEFPSDRIGAVLSQINRTLPASIPLIVVCRAVEYEMAVQAGDVLAGALVVESQPVRPRAVAGYLRTAIAPVHVQRWQPITQALAQGSCPPLAEALSSPLNMSLARAVYRVDGDPAELLRFASADAIESHLIASLVPSAISSAHPPVSYDVDDAVAWLGFLARHLDESSTRDFAWWRLPRALRRTMVWIYALVAVVAVAAAVFGVVLIARTATGVVGLATGVAVALLISLHTVLTGLRRDSPLVRPSFRLAGRMRALLRQLAEGIWLGLLAGLMGGPVGVFLIRVVAGVDVSVTRIVVGAVSGGLLAGTARAFVFWSLKPGSISEDMSPIETLRAARNRALVAGLGLGVAVGLACAGIIGVYLGQALNVDGGPALGAALGAAYGVSIAAIVLLAGPWFPYTLAHSLLATRGTLPWSFMTFLDEAHRLGILRRIGAVYQFRHARIQDHLALVTADP